MASNFKMAHLAILYDAIASIAIHIYVLINDEHQKSNGKKARTESFRIALKPDASLHRLWATRMLCDMNNVAPRNTFETQDPKSLNPPPWASSLTTTSQLGKVLAGFVYDPITGCIISCMHASNLTLIHLLASGTAWSVQHLIRQRLPRGFAALLAFIDRVYFNSLYISQYLRCCGDLSCEINIMMPLASWSDCGQCHPCEAKLPKKWPR